MAGEAEDAGRARRTLYLLRHAKSAWKTDASSDFDRPLSKRGERDAPRMGAWLHGQGVEPDYLVSSPARRAWQTARHICEGLGVEESRVACDRRIYEAGVAELLEVLSECPAGAGSILLIGHNPGLEELVAFLCGEAGLPTHDKLMPTGAVAGLGIAAAWNRLERGCGRLEILMHPKMLD
jgi:phosphohistidine phosphatase